MSPDGVLVVDKPGGMTSHDVVAQARRIFHTREVGHAGTLDPMATGVLLLLFGEATKLSNFLTNDDKRYRATVSFGRATDTLDAEGTTTQEARVTPEQLADDRVRAALDLELTRVLQLPPAVSAIKIDGRRAHALVRAGQTPKLDEREVRLHEITMHGRNEHSLTLELRVSKGYYVRAFARDLGASLGVPAHLSALRRLASGSFDLSLACPWPPNAEETPLLATARAAERTLPSARLSEAGLQRARLGKPLELGDFTQRPTNDGRTEAWLSEHGELIALGAEREPGVFRVVRGFRAPAP